MEETEKHLISSSKGRDHAVDYSCPHEVRALQHSFKELLAQYALRPSHHPPVEETERHLISSSKGRGHAVDCSCPLEVRALQLFTFIELLAQYALRPSQHPPLEEASHFLQQGKRPCSGLLLSTGSGDFYNSFLLKSC